MFRISIGKENLVFAATFGDERKYRKSFKCGLVVASN